MHSKAVGYITVGRICAQRFGCYSASAYLRSYLPIVEISTLTIFVAITIA